jgi:hypothetical protein
MSLENRIAKLEAANGNAGEWDLTRLTDAELLNLHAAQSKAEATGKPVADYITPELFAALERIKR